MAISLFKAYFVGHFGYHTNAKSVNECRNFYTLINQSKEICEKLFSDFGSRGDPISPDLVDTQYSLCTAINVQRYDRNTTFDLRFAIL